MSSTRDDYCYGWNYFNWGPLAQCHTTGLLQKSGPQDNGKLTQIRLGMFGNEAGALGAALMASAQERINRDL